MTWIFHFLQEKRTPSFCLLLLYSKQLNWTIQRQNGRHQLHTGRGSRSKWIIIWYIKTELYRLNNITSGLNCYQKINAKIKEIITLTRYLPENIQCLLIETITPTTATASQYRNLPVTGKPHQSYLNLKLHLISTLYESQPPLLPASKLLLPP